MAALLRNAAAKLTGNNRIPLPARAPDVVCLFKRSNNMETLRYVACIGFFAFTAGTSVCVHAQIGVNMEHPCATYEFDELKTYSDHELRSMENQYETIARNIDSGPTPMDVRELEQDMAAKKNCMDEAGRINRILAGRVSERDPTQGSGAGPRHPSRSMKNR
jgi:hypothetical protein